MIELYHAAGSVCSIKARIGLAETGVNWTSRDVDLSRGEQYGPEYLALNPDAVVPTLVDDGLVVRETSLILEYLDETHAGGAFMPREKRHRVAAKLWLIKCIAIHAGVNSLTFATNFREIQLKRTEAEREAWLAAVPDPATAEKRRDLLDKGVASAHATSALAMFRQMVGTMDDAIVNDGFVAGPGYSLGDMALTAYFDRLDRLGLAGLWKGTALPGWLEAMRARPSYDSAAIAYLGPAPTGAAAVAAAARWQGVL